MKIYRVVFRSIDIDESDHTIIITTFLNRNNAMQYYKDRLKDLKQQQKELDMDDYRIDEEKTSYERYLNGRAMENSVALWIEEDDTYDELVLQKQNEKDKDYEM